MARRRTIWRGIGSRPRSSAQRHSGSVRKRRRSMRRYAPGFLAPMTRLGARVRAMSHPLEIPAGTIATGVEAEAEGGMAVDSSNTKHRHSCTSIRPRSISDAQPAVRARGSSSTRITRPSQTMFPWRGATTGRHLDAAHPRLSRTGISYAGQEGRMQVDEEGSGSQAEEITMVDLMHSVEALHLKTSNTDNLNSRQDFTSHRQSFQPKQPRAPSR